MPREMTYCNCAGCSTPLLGDTWRAWYKKLPADLQQELHPPVAGRILQRPYCNECLKVRKPMALGAPRAKLPEDPSADVEGAVKHMEEG